MPEDQSTREPRPAGSGPAPEATAIPPRRSFLNMAVGGSAAALAAAIGYPVSRFAEPRPRASSGPVSVGKLDEIPLGTARTVLVNERPVLLLRGADGQLRAFSAICTHLQCVVGYSAERKQIECPCHQGVYSMDGQNVSGPPPRKLEELEVAINEGTVIVSAV
jgi:cytochrome b6-f complex iron-sulfur subunit